MSTNSKRPKAAQGSKTALKWTCTFDFVDHEGVKRKGKGRTFHIDGRDVDLFPSGVLCAVLHRSRKALYVWEEKFGFPPALFHLADDERKKRWYSRQQIAAIRALYEHEAFGRLQGKNYNKLGQFVASVRDVFWAVHLLERKPDAAIVGVTGEGLQDGRGEGALGAAPL